MKPNKPIITCFVMALKKHGSQILLPPKIDIYLWCLSNLFLYNLTPQNTQIWLDAN